MAGTITTDATTTERQALTVQVGPLYAVVLAALAFLRVASTNAIHVMFVDDALFLSYVRWNGPWETITYARTGYLNVAAMTAAQALEWVPDQFAPMAYIAVASVGIGLLGWFVADASRAFLSSTAARMAAGAAVALVPIAAIESIGTVANLQWYLMAGATFALACRVNTPTAVAIVALAAVSAPAALALAPLVAWHGGRRIIIAWVTGVAVQVFAIAVNWGNRDGGGSAWFDMGGIVRTAVVSPLNGATTDNAGAYAPGVFTLAALTLIVVALTRQSQNRPVVSILVVGGLLQWWFTYGGGAPHSVDPRYNVAPAIIATAVTLWAAESIDRRLLWATCVAFAFVWVSTFQASFFRAQTGDDWGRQLDEQPCESGVQTLLPAPDHLSTTPTVELPC